MFFYRIINLVLYQLVLREEMLNVNDQNSILKLHELS